MKKLITLLFAWILAFSAIGQVELNFTPSSTTADPGQTVTVDLTVQNFVDIIGLEFEVGWDNSVLEFQNIITYDNILCEFNGNPAPCFTYSPIPNQGSIGPNTITNLFVAQYLDDIGNPYANTLNNGDKILTVEFLVVGNAGQTSDIAFTGNALVINAGLQELSLSNGGVTVSNATFAVNGTGCAGTGPITFTASDESGDTNDQRTVQISVDNFEEVEGFGFNISWDPAVVSFDGVSNVNLQGLVNPPPPAQGNFTNNNSTLFVSWDEATGVTVCDGHVIFELNYTLIGSGGTSSLIEFTGNIEVIRNSLLEDPTINNGSITIQNGTGGGGGNGDITFDAGEVTGENGDQVCVPFTVANFDQVTSFQYEINWDETVMTYAQILDGNGQPLVANASGNPLNLLLPPAPAIGNFGLTNVANGNLSVAWDNQAGVTVADDVSVYEVCFDIIGSTGESSNITYGGTIEGADANGIADLNLEPGSVTVTGVFDGLELSWDCCEKIQMNDNVCIDVLVDAGFVSIGSMQYGMEWDPNVLTFTGFAFGNGNPLGLNIGSQLVGFANDGNAKLLWSDNLQTGVNLDPGTSLYQVCFDVTGSIGSSTDLQMGALPNATPPFAVEVSVKPTDEVIDFLGNSCTTEVDDLGTMALTATPTSPSCVGGGDGSLDLSVTGGSPSYTFSWSTSADSEDISDLTAGSYTVTVTDCSGGTAEETFTIADPTPINVTANITGTSGAGNDGEIALNVTGGSGTYTTYTWNPNVGSTATVTGLSTGSYSVTVTDDNGCTGEGTFQVGSLCDNTNISITTNITDVSGAGNDGEIDITPAGGASPYTFAWADGPTGEDRTGLAAGSYTVTVTDANQCTGEQTFQVVEICASTTISITANITDVSGAGNDGEIDITPAGGATPYTFAWADGPTGEDRTGLTVGSYTVTVTDANLCTAEQTFSVATGCLPIDITANITHESSAGNDGSITVTSSGGTAPYNYAWSPNVGSGATVNNLAAGNYTVTATDTNGCTGTNTFTVDAFNCPTISVTASGTNVTCTGGSDGSATANATGGTAPYSYDWGANPNALAAGTYTVTATDVDGCFGTATVTIGDGVTIGLNVVNTNNVNCFGDNSGSITISGTNGTAPYTANWGGGLTGLTISNLSAGSYTPTITDANGCQATGSAITITQPNDISISGTPSNTLCNGSSDGSISLNISGGTPGYSVSWSNGMSGQTINNLPAGTYTPTVTDANNCVKIGNAITVGQPAALNVVATVTDASCAGNCDGAISLAISGGTGGYTVNWSNGDTGTSVSGLCGGNISVTVTDANNCTFSDVYTIVQPEVFTLDFDVTNESVAGGDGAVDLTVTPAGTYTYQWSASNDPSFNPITQDINNLVADIYSVTVTDPSTGCFVTGFASVTNSLGIQTALDTDISCNGGSDGSIEIVTVGGDMPYSWVWSGPNNFSATTESIFNVEAGDYAVTITDAMGVVLIETFTLTEPDPITLSFVIQDELDFCDGAIDLTVAGGVGPYTYQWNNGELSEDLTDLCDNDNYQVTVTDANGCFVVSEQMEIEPQAPSIGSHLITNVSCPGELDGSIQITLVGGNPPFTLTCTPLGGAPITVTSNSHTYTFGALGAGTHLITGMDVAGNPIPAQQFVITEPTPITISNVIITNQTPGICNGAINITVTGGTAPYTFLWSNGDTSEDLIDVCANVSPAKVQITDANGCVYESEEYTIVEIIDAAFTLQHINCFGEQTGVFNVTVNGGMPPYSYEWVDGNGTLISTEEDLVNVGAGTYTLTVTDMMGFNATISSTINEPTLLEIVGINAIQPTLPTCSNGSIGINVTGGSPSYSYLWKDEDGNDIGTTPSISNLIGGAYFVTVTDENGCTEEAEVILPDCEIDGVDSITQISCPDECDGIIEFTPNSGTAPYFYDWSNGETTSTIKDLCAGVYDLTVTDDNGVELTRSFTINDVDPIEVTIETSPGRAEAIVIGGTPAYTYQWDDEITQESFVEDLRGGVHVLMVTDANGCQTEMTQFEVPYGTDCLTARSVISPNEDGLNDVFYVNCVENQPVKVTIFNRWGQEVFQVNEYDNSWAGTNQRGELLIEGGYFYVLEYEDQSGAKQTIKGSLSIVR